MSDALVVLRFGVSVPADAYRLLLSFESRGLSIGRDGDCLRAGPRDRLTDADVVDLKRLKPHLLALCDYVGRTDIDAHLFHPDTRPGLSHA